MANNQQHNGSNISALSDKNHNGGVGLASLICAIIGFGLSIAGLVIVGVGLLIKYLPMIIG